MEFTVTKGLHTKGSCVVVKHGEMELWLKPAAATRLGSAMVVIARALILEDQEIRRKARRR